MLWSPCLLSADFGVVSVIPLPLIPWHWLCPLLYPLPLPASTWWTMHKSESLVSNKFRFWIGVHMLIIASVHGMYTSMGPSGPCASINSINRITLSFSSLGWSAAATLRRLFVWRVWWCYQRGRSILIFALESVEWKSPDLDPLSRFLSLIRRIKSDYVRVDVLHTLHAFQSALNGWFFCCSFLDSLLLCGLCCPFFSKALFSLSNCDRLRLPLFGKIQVSPNFKLI